MRLGIFFNFFSFSREIFLTQVWKRGVAFFFRHFLPHLYLFSWPKSSNLQEYRNLFSFFFFFFFLEKEVGERERDLEKKGYLFFNPLLTSSPTLQRSSFVRNCSECTQRQSILSRGFIYLQVGGGWCVAKLQDDDGACRKGGGDEEGPLGSRVPAHLSSKTNPLLDSLNCVGFLNNNPNIPRPLAHPLNLPPISYFPIVYSTILF